MKDKNRILFLFLFAIFLIILISPICSDIIRLYFKFVKQNIASYSGHFLFIFLTNSMYYILVAYSFPSFVVFKKITNKKQIFLNCCFHPLMLCLIPIIRNLYFMISTKKNLPSLFYNVVLIESFLGILSYSIALNFYNKWKNEDFNDFIKMKRIFFDNLNLKYFLIIILILIYSVYLELNYYA